MKNELQLLIEANDILRSVNAIIERRGKITNWEGIKQKVKLALAEQHELLLAKNCYQPDIKNAVCFLCNGSGKTIASDDSEISCPQCYGQTVFTIYNYSNEALRVILGHTYGGEGYIGITDGVDVRGKLTEINIQLDSATIWSDQHNMPCAVKLRSLYAI
jgi:hypothetical protein